MMPTNLPHIRRESSSRLRAFTLVELMVAVTGGLFISIIVFAMARQGTRFYQQESRIAEATLAATIGMQRLRADIGRAGYMTSPNITADSSLCTNLAALNGFNLLQTMSGIQILQEPDGLIKGNADLVAAKILPDRILLAGAYQNADRFIAGYLPTAPGAGAAQVPIPLQPGIGALVRYGYAGLAAADQVTLLSSLFPIGRTLRLVNQYGRVAYGIIAGTTTTGGPNGNLPVINLLANPVIPLRGAANNVCVFSGVGVEVNVVNFYQYRIADVKRSPAYGGLFGQLYASSANPWDANRTELIREELDPALGQPFTQTNNTGTVTTYAPEIISEYAVDLKFEVTYANPWPSPNQLLTTSPTTNQTVYTIAGIVTGPNAQPQSVRSVRIRLSVRSREADRDQSIPGTGLYRLGITTNNKTTYARVRTLQSDVALPNNFRAN
jgi:hypothetical protein